jgi:O-antigen/teichoic acid export membrane protein
MKREKELIKNTIIIGFGTMLPKFASLITLPIITAKLTKADMGIYDLISTLIALFLPVVTLQIQTAAFRFLIECEDDNEDKRSIVSTMLWFIGIVSIIAVSFLFFVLKQFDITTRLLIACYFFIDIVLIMLQQVARGLHQNKLYSVSAIAVSFVNMLLVLLTVQIINYGLNGVLFSIAVASLVSIIIIVTRIRVWKYISLRCFSITKFKELLAYSWPMIPNSLSNWVMNLSDRLVIIGFLGIEANAVYSVANKIPNLFTSIQGTFVMAWQENASSASEDDDISTYYTKMFQSVFSILFAIMACLIAATPILFKILIRGDYSNAYYQMPILYIALLFSAISSFIGGIYVACKQTKSIGITTMIAAAINFVVIISLVKSIGIYAGSISTLVSFLCLAIFRMKNIRKFVYVRYDYKRIIIMCLILSLLSVTCYQRNNALNVINFVIAVSAALIFNKDIVVMILDKLFRKIS